MNRPGMPGGRPAECATDCRPQGPAVPDRHFGTGRTAGIGTCRTHDGGVAVFGRPLTPPRGVRENAGRNRADGALRNRAGHRPFGPGPRDRGGLPHRTRQAARPHRAITPAHGTSGKRSGLVPELCDRRGNDQRSHPREHQRNRTRADGRTRRRKPRKRGTDRRRGRPHVRTSRELPDLLRRYTLAGRPAGTASALTRPSAFDDDRRAPARARPTRPSPSACSTRPGTTPTTAE
jgi:hypothetical protein